MIKRILLTLAFTFASALTATGMVLAQGPPGNNGTLKVHEQGTPSGTESNDPKVCVFNFEGFGFDPGQTGAIDIDTQGGGPGSTTVKTLNFGPADSSGYYATGYLNASAADVPNGMYKATLYGKDTGGNVDRTDEKAKSKVFKVECQGRGGPETPPEEKPPVTVPTPVTPSGGQGGGQQVAAAPAPTAGRGAAAPEVTVPQGAVNAGEGSSSTSAVALGGLAGSLSLLGYGLRRFVRL